VSNLTHDLTLRKRTLPLKRLTKLLLAASATLGIVALPACADPLGQSSCNFNAGVCNVYEGSLFQNSNAFFYAGDLVLLDANGAFGDIVRFYNDIIDTGGGTGFGDAFLEFRLPDGHFPGDVDLSSLDLSANAVFITEGPAVAGIAVTDYTGPSGTLFHIYSSAAVPEPSELSLIASGLLFVAAWIVKRQSKKPASSARLR
jgi:hypothetical protein